MGRTCAVRIRGGVSRIIDVLSGVPQGSSLGPLLFIIFINQLLLITTCFILFYADDMKLCRAITSADDFDQLQSDLDRVVDWCMRNDLKINLSKTVIITYHPPALPYTSHTYYIDSAPVVRVSEVRDLGVIYDSELSFSSHLGYVCRKASKVLGLITRNTKDFSKPETLCQLYKSYVIPILIYASPVWSPHLKYEIEFLESVQRRFLRSLSRFTDKPMTRFDHDFKAIAKKFNTPLLKSLHNYFDVLTVWKILNNHFKSPDLAQLFVTRPTNYSLRSHNPLYTQIFRRESEFNSSIPRLSRAWNSLDSALRNIDAIGRFKTAARRAILDFP